MSRLKELSQDKVTIMMRLISNKNLCKALHYTDDNFLEKPDIDDPSILIYENIFPYKMIPDTVDETKTFITMSFNRYKQVGNAFKSGVIFLNILVNKNNMRTDYGYLRTDFIVSEIDELINQRLGIGIGKTKFFSMDDVVFNKDYLGVEIGYQVYDFN